MTIIIGGCRGVKMIEVAYGTFWYSGDFEEFRMVTMKIAWGGDHWPCVRINEKSVRTIIGSQPQNAEATGGDKTILENTSRPLFLMQRGIIEPIFVGTHLVQDISPFWSDEGGTIITTRASLVSRLLQIILPWWSPWFHRIFLNGTLRTTGNCYIYTEEEDD